VKAYPYDVELKTENPNTKEVRLLAPRRVYAYTVMDAVMQAIYEAAESAGSAEIKVVRVGPPIECCETLSQTWDTLLRKLAATAATVPTEGHPKT
jgi:hypothetical protein